MHACADVYAGTHGHQRLFVHKLEQRGIVFGQPRDIGGYGHTIRLVIGQLRFDIEKADALDIIAEKVDAHRPLVIEAEDIKDAATHGHLSGYVDVVDFAEAIVQQRL